MLGGIAAQGHASVTSRSTLQVGAQLVHIVAAAVWIAGLALLALIRTGACRPWRRRRGPALSTRLLARFSRVALVAVALVIITGVIRSLGELDDPAQLWDTAYGRSILYQGRPAAARSARWRSTTGASWRRCGACRGPTSPTMRLVRRMAASELALSLAVVVIASLLVAQVPGGT